MSTQYAAQTITITATTLATASARESASITTDTSVNVNDYRIYVKPTLANTTLTGAKAVFVWLKVSDDGTNWDGNATASDAAYTLDAPHQHKLLGVIPSVINTSRGASFSLKAACGGIPNNWGIIIENQTGAAFTACTAVARKEYTT